MVWDCVGGAGMGKLKRSEGKIDAEVYYRILRHQMEPTMTLQGGQQSFIFMQDKLLKYIRSMPSRIEAVIQAKGWHLKY